MATAHIEPAHVITATLEILKNLKVEKDGTLPSNMGGKKYATASNVSFAVKEEFAKNSLIIEPNEELIKHEIVPFKDRLNIAVVVTGHYRIISAKDGSELTISGTGDGLATGTAVASNIASTNAIKNALLRYLLITEQSVEDEAKNGTEPKPNRALQNAKKATPVAKADPIGTVKARIRQEFIDSGKFTASELNSKVKEIEGSTSKKGADLYEAVYEALKAEGK